MNGYSEVSIFLLIILSLFLSLPIWLRLVQKRRIDVFEPIYSFISFYFLLFVLQPFILIHYSSPLTETVSFPLAILYSLLGLLAMYIGYYNRIGSIISNYFPVLKSQYSTRRFFIVLLLFTGVGVGASLWFYFGIVKEGITWAITHSLELNNKYLKTGTGYITWGMFMLPQAFFLLYAFALKFSRLNTIKIVLIIYFIFVFLVLFPLGARWVGVVLISVPLIVRHYYLNKKIKLYHIIFAFPIVISIFGLMNLYRGLGSISLGNISFFQFLIGTLSGDLLTPFNNFVILIQALDDNLIDFTYGLYYLYLLIAPIPRALWPDKPIVSVEWAFTKAVFGYDPLEGPTLTMTLPGELYFNFHVAGIVVGMVIWGIFWRSIYTYTLRNRTNVGIVLLYGLLLLTGFNAIRTAWQVFIISTFVNIVPIFLALLYITGGKLTRTRIFNITEQNKVCS